MKKYKVWVSIEEVDEEEGTTENIGEPEELDEFDDLDTAQDAVANLF